jgi:SNF2 family DNA or RNA helicase
VDDTIDPAKLVYRLRRKMISAGIDPYDGHKIISQNKHKDAVEYWKWYQEPLLVTSAFREPIADVADLFRKAGAKVAVIHGGVSDEKRNVLRKDFMAGKYDIVVAQTKTIKMGLNFSRANTILVLSNTDSGSDREQLVDRIQHMEATEVKSIIDIHSQGSIDEKVLEGLGAKEKESISYFK